MNKRSQFGIIGSNSGFTLIELISTLVIISVLAAVLIPRYIDAENSSRMRGLDMGISEMNGRETLTWALVKLSQTGYVDDQNLYDYLKASVGFDLGSDYVWQPSPPPATGGGTLRFKDTAQATVSRSPSSRETPGRWTR